MKATSIFGGVQVFNIIISIIRSKIVAVLLGPTGMGVFGLYTTAMSLLGGLTNFGLSTSAVRNIAAANERGHTEDVIKVVTVLRRLVWLTGILGALVALLGAPWISKATFGTEKYTTAFYWLSVSLLINQLAVGQNVLLQGLRQLAYLAKANMLGSLMSLLFSIPLYYFLRVDGIVPAMIVTSFCTMFVAWYYARKTFSKQVVGLTTQYYVSEGKSMLKMGFLLSLSSFASLGESFFVRAYINNNGSMADVGLYTAGFAIIGTYVGMVFNAMSTDYYPRLSSVANNSVATNQLINQQAEVAILILAPVLMLFLVFVDWGVIILYSKEFLPICNMMHWAALGIFFKAASWAMGFIFLAKADTKVFFLNELFMALILLVFNILGYKYWKLEGLGISFLLAYIICFFEVLFILKKRYSVSLERMFFKIFLLQLGLALLCFLIINRFLGTWKYFGGVLLIIFSLIYSFLVLDKRMNLKQILIKK